MRKLRCAIIGTGFWANFQVPAWQELDGVEIVAACDRQPDRVRALGEKFGITRLYEDAEAMMDEVKPDFVDIITDVDTHAHFAELALRREIDVICQKPMAATLPQAQAMVGWTQEGKARLFIHENFRWQAPIRALKQAMDSGVVGAPFKARVSFCSAFPVFENQPLLAELDKFIITDVGSHILDICRFLFGEARSLYCLTRRVNPSIQGEDVANVLLEMKNGVHCFAEMSYASILEKESFPQTLLLVEGDKGSLHLTHDFELKITTKTGTESRTIAPILYPWLDPDYAVVHASIVDCNRDILHGLRGGTCETTGADNLKTVELVWACYESAEKKEVILI